MGKDLLIKMLQDQLKAANTTNIRLDAAMKSMEANFNATVAGLQQTISDLRKTIANLESLLKERDGDLDDGSRSEKVILDELNGYEGVIQSDGLGAIPKYGDGYFSSFLNRIKICIPRRPKR